MEFQPYFEQLKQHLMPLYVPPRVTAGHDWPHCDRMAQWGPKILGIQGLPEQGRLRFDMDEYVTGCWLHNYDRVAGVEGGNVEGDLRALLCDSPFATERREGIIADMKAHPKFMDEPRDDHRLTALRIADKLDRLDDSTLGIMVACAFNGTRLLFYDPANPFHCASTAERALKSLYNDFTRQLEWYKMLPSDEARGLVNMESLRFYITFVRRFAAAVTRHLNCENLVEDDIRQAFGPYYPRVVPKRWDDSDHRVLSRGM